MLQAAVVVGKDQPPDLAYLVPKEAPKEVETPGASTELKGNKSKKNNQLLRTHLIYSVLHVSILC